VLVLKDFFKKTHQTDSSVAFELPSIFKRSAPPLLGIDISSSSVKVVELEKGVKSKLKLERYAIEPLDRGVVVDGNIENPEAVADALLRALKKCGSRTKNAALALPASSVITKKIVLPAGLRDEEYEQQVEMEASQYIPFPIEEVNLDFQVLGASNGNEEDVDVLLAASRKEKVEDRVVIAEMSGLKAVVMDVDNYAARTSMDQIVAFLPNRGTGLIIALFQIGTNTTSLTVSLNDQTIFERQHGFGGAQLTQDIVRMYGLAPEEAEAKKRTGDLPDNYQTDILAPFLESVSAEANRALQFFYTSTPYSRVDHVFLAGGSAALPGIVEAIGTKLNVATEVLSPFQGMEINPSIRERQFRLDAPSLLVACGLAMRRFDQ
jgi:type IV pilus assembly protein PilM